MRQYNPFPPRPARPVFESDEVVPRGPKKPRVSEPEPKPTKAPKQPKQPKAPKAPKPVRQPEPAKTEHKVLPQGRAKARKANSNYIKGNPLAGLMTAWFLGVWVPVVIGIVAFQTRDKPQTQQALETLQFVSDKVDGYEE